MESIGLIITTAIPDFDKIKDMADLPALEDHLTSGMTNLWNQIRYVKALEERIRELRRAN